MLPFSLLPINTAELPKLPETAPIVRSVDAKKVELSPAMYNFREYALGYKADVVVNKPLELAGSINSSERIQEQINILTQQLKSLESKLKLAQQELATYQQSPEFKKIQALKLKLDQIDNSLKVEVLQQLGYDPQKVDAYIDYGGDYNVLVTRNADHTKSPNEDGAIETVANHPLPIGLTVKAKEFNRIRTQIDLAEEVLELKQYEVGYFEQQMNDLVDKIDNLKFNRDVHPATLKA
jgi:hypothetical protein